ncbi:retrovirus-related pol polyprotein from transposon TNT 1-94 [Tanacetum coccineum]
MTSSITRFDIENFDGKNDFGLWQVKVRALFVHTGYDAALETLPADMEAAEKADLMKKACGIWTKLTSLYMTKSLANRLYLKKKLYAYYMSQGTKLSDHIDEFIKLILDLVNIDIEIEDKDQALYHPCKAHSGGSSWFKSKGGTGKLKCFVCHIEGHLKSDCPMKKSSGSVRKGKRDQCSDSSNDEGNDYFGKALVVVRNDEITELAMDSDGSYHMTHRRSIPVFGLGWNCKELKGIMKLRFFKLVTMMLQWLKDIMVIGVPGQEGVEGNVAEKKKVKESKKVNLGKLLKYNVWSTRWSPVRVLLKSLQASGQSLLTHLSISWNKLGTIPTSLDLNKTVKKEFMTLGEINVIMGQLGLQQCCSTYSNIDILSIFDEEGPTLDEVKVAFDVFDENTDGFIDEYELRKMLCKLGQQENTMLEGCRNMIKGFDVNGDGLLDLDEFVRLMETCSF